MALVKAASRPSWAARTRKRIIADDDDSDTMDSWDKKPAPFRKGNNKSRNNGRRKVLSMHSVSSSSSSIDENSEDHWTPSSPSKETDNDDADNGESIPDDTSLDKSISAKKKGLASKVQGLTSVTISKQQEQPLEWDNAAWSPRKRRRTEKKDSAGEDAVAVIDGPKKRYRLDTSNPTVAAYVDSCTYPSSDTAGGEICRRMRHVSDHAERQHKRLFFDIAYSPAPVEPFQPLGDVHATLSPYALFRWLRVRMTAGLVRSSFSILHKQLQKGYEDAKKVMGKMDSGAYPEMFVSELMAIRDRLASLWCVYVHFIIEVGKLTLFDNEISVFEKKRPATTNSAPVMSRNLERKVTFASDASVVAMDSLASIRDNAEENQSATEEMSSTDETEDSFTTTASAATACEPEEMPTKRKASKPKSHSSPKRRTKYKKKLGGANRKKQVEPTRRESPQVMFQDLAHHAMSILWKVRDCPLVGNHTAISIGLGRLMVSSFALKETKIESKSTQLSRGRVIKTIQSAVATCWGAMDPSRRDSTFAKEFTLSNSTSKNIHEYLSFVDFPGKKLQHEKRISHQTLHGELKTMLELPRYLRARGGSLENASFFFNDQNAKRSLCTELNRWSRLAEKLKVCSQTTFSLKPTCGVNGNLAFMEEELPLFSPVSVQYSKMDLFSADDEEQAMILWEW